MKRYAELQGDLQMQGIKSLCDNILYLVGTIDRWNNAKKAEEKDRVKHDG